MDYSEEKMADGASIAYDNGYNDAIVEVIHICNNLREEEGSKLKSSVTWNTALDTVVTKLKVEYELLNGNESKSN